VRRAALNALPAALVPLALAWVGAARGVAPPAWLAVATVAVVGVLVAWRLVEGTTWHVPLSWLAGLVGWAALAAAVRPVAPAPAAWLVAIGVVAVGLALVAATPRGAAWSAAAVVTAGAACAGWLIVERLTVAARPAGPFGNPNPAATVPLLALAFVPWLRTSIAIRIVLGVPLVAGVLASGSRGGLLGLLALGLAWGIAASGARVRRAAVIVALVAAVVLALRLATDRDPLRFGRLRIWRAAAGAALAELPLGAGPSGFVDAVLPHNFPRDGEAARYHRIPALAESDVLQLATTLGLPGVACGLGLALAMVRRLRGARGCGVAAALAATSAVNTQLIVPAVAWVATLAVAAVLPRPRGRPVRLAPLLTAALLLAVAVPVALALRWPSAGLGEDPASLIARADAAWSATPSDPALADAEALAWRATRLVPRNGRAWRTLGTVQLERARRRGDAGLARAAAATFAEARRVNPLDAWAALGQGQAQRLVGEAAAARTALEAAVRLEPNFVPAWLELALLDLERGDLVRAHEALTRITAARQRRIPAAFVSDYERALLAADPALLQRVRAAVGADR
jgi:tetratricopeptide (TPR) repeat protein